MELAISFLETIRLENGVFPYLPYHQNRFDRTRKFHFPTQTSIRLAEVLKVPIAYERGVYKVSVEYHADIVQESYTPYVIRTVKSLKLIDGKHIDYKYKYADRSAINALFAKRGECDDILMVKDGRLTDTSYANIILYDGQFWYTPATPLMQGTCRARLIEEGKVLPTDIYVEHLKDFQEIRLINAMMSFEEGPKVAVSDVSVGAF